MIRSASRGAIADGRRNGLSSQHVGAVQFAGYDAVEQDFQLAWASGGEQTFFK